MKQVKYQLHSDFKGFEIFRFPNLKVFPLMLDVFNFIGTINSAMTKPIQGVKKTTGQVKGYHSGKVQLTIYEP